MRSSCCGSATSGSRRSGSRCSGPPSTSSRSDRRSGGGALSDRFGRRSLIAVGWLWYAAIYAGFGFFDPLAIVIAIFLAYGVYFGSRKATRRRGSPTWRRRTARGTAFGIYNAVLGVGALAASLVFGWIWTRVSPHAAFLTGAGSHSSRAGAI